MSDCIVMTLALSIGGLGVGLVGSTLIGRSFVEGASSASSWFLWVCTALGLAASMFVARPSGLFKVKPIDVLWGLALGMAMRLVQGGFERANDRAFPAGPAHWSSWWLEAPLPSILVAPGVEELMFRGFLMVAIYQILNPKLGVIGAASAAVFLTSVAFVIVHAIYQDLDLADGLQLLLLSVAAAVIVFLTGRVAGAVMMHATYNATYVMITGFGALLA